MIYLPGGPSHMDMYDLKPDAPKEFRGEFNPIATNVPGVQICEHSAASGQDVGQAGLRALHRNCSTDEHSDSLVSTGFAEAATIASPTIRRSASVISVLCAAGPPVVRCRPTSACAACRGHGTEPGFLGVAHRPFTPGGYAALQNLRLPQGVNLDRLEQAARHWSPWLRRHPPRSRHQGHLSPAWIRSRPAPSRWSPPAPSAMHSTLAKPTPRRAIATRASSSSSMQGRLVEAGVG